MADVQWIPVRAAAKMLGVSKQRVHRMAAKGLLAKMDYDGTVLISLRTVLARIERSSTGRMDFGGGLG